MSDVSVKMPEAGEYWQSNAGVRIRIVGKGLREFDYVCIYNQGQSTVVEWKITGHVWRYLPGCDSFSWEEPKFAPTPSVQEIVAKRVEQVFEERFRIDDEESVAAAERPLPWKADEIAAYEQKRIDDATAILTKLEADVAAGNSFPQYWTALAGDAAYVKRTGPDAYVLVRKDGTGSPVRPWSTDANYRRLLTEAEAIALLDDPEAWFDLKTAYPYHKLRDGIDEVQVTANSNWWHPVKDAAGLVVKDWDYGVRCRRKDIPATVPADPIPAATDEPWVVQNRLSVRDFCDEIHWSTWPVGHWEKATDDFRGLMHGAKRGKAVLSVRCQMSRLPDLTPWMLYREVKPYVELPSGGDVTDSSF